MGGVGLSFYLCIFHWEHRNVWVHWVQAGIMTTLRERNTVVDCTKFSSILSIASNSSVSSSNLRVVLKFRETDG